MADTNYTVNYDDKRFAEVESDKKQALTELEKTYGGMINSSDEYYNAQIEASKEWADKQTELQQAQTDFAIKEIEQQKEQTRKDYIKEQSAAYVDWQKQSNPYGAQAEQMAAQGMTNTGYAESSQVAMYNQYQTRVTTGREAYNLAVQNYNNAITEARLQNNAILAEIAYEAMQQQLELALQGFQYKNSLLLELADKKLKTEAAYNQQYLEVLEQIENEAVVYTPPPPPPEPIKNDSRFMVEAKAASGTPHNIGGTTEILGVAKNPGALLAYANTSSPVPSYPVSPIMDERELMDRIADKAEQNIAEERKNNILGVSQSSGVTNPLKDKAAQNAARKTAVFGGSTLSEAVEFAVANGVPRSKTSSILPEGEWVARSGAKYSTVAELKKAYAEYLKQATAALIKQYNS